MRWFRWIVIIIIIIIIIVIIIVIVIIVIVIIISVVRVCAVRRLRSRTKIFPIVEKHLLRRVSSSRTRARNSVMRRIILQRRSIFPVSVPTRGWESKSCHYSLRTIESNPPSTRPACAHVDAFKRTSRARPGKIHRSHTQTQRARARETRTHAFGASRATTRRERCVVARLRACSSEVLTFKYRSELHIFSLQIFPSLLRAPRRRIFSPVPDATPDAHATRSHRRRHASKTTRVLRKALERSSRC